jgi:cation diffusion facilitator CzcD-associated flavoprotein CzcO
MAEEVIQANTKLNIAVIGAGVGGLSNAIALRQTGYKVTVYEQAPVLSEVYRSLFKHFICCLLFKSALSIPRSPLHLYRVF